MENNTEERGLIHIYTGDGKGKTTSAIGLALRSLGYDRKVVYVHFHKRPEVYGYKEIEMLKKNGAVIFGFGGPTPLCDDSCDLNVLKEEVQIGFQKIIDYIKTHDADMLILDEISISMSLDLISSEQMIDFMRDKPQKLELVLTGRYAKPEIIELADYVSVVQKEKHPYDQGVLSRKGIEC